VGCLMGHPDRGNKEHRPNSRGVHVASGLTVTRNDDGGVWGTESVNIGHSRLFDSAHATQFY